jgi:hypothetical protein
MTMLSGWRNKTVLRFKALFYRRQLDRDLEDEVAFHLSMAEEKNRAQGLDPDESHHAARRQFGNYSQAKQRSRDMWTFVAF